MGITKLSKEKLVSVPNNIKGNSSKGIEKIGPK
jgi:hypothetical protein